MTAHDLSWSIHLPCGRCGSTSEQGECLPVLVAPTCTCDNAGAEFPHREWCATQHEHPGPDCPGLCEPSAPARGEFCHRHFSWLCQAGQGKCQRGEEQP